MSAILSSLTRISCFGLAQMNLDGIVLLVRSKPKACQTVSTNRSTTHGKSIIDTGLSEQFGSLRVSSAKRNEVR